MQNLGLLPPQTGRGVTADATTATDWASEGAHPINLKSSEGGSVERGKSCETHAVASNEPHSFDRTAIIVFFAVVLDLTHRWPFQCLSLLCLQVIRADSVLLSAWASRKRLQLDHDLAEIAYPVRLFLRDHRCCDSEGPGCRRRGTLKLLQNNLTAFIQQRAHIY